MSVLDRGFFARAYRKIVHKFYRNDLWIDLCLRAKAEAVDYILAHMPDAQVLEDRFALLRFALARAPQNGLVLEFGVEKGDSLRWIARHTARPVHGFDSFQGLPEDWHGTKETRGKFDRKGRLPAVPANVSLHVGWFDRTLPPFLAATAGPVALAHIDCDIYESTKTVLDLMGERIAPGAWIVFDEYFNYPGWRLHEFKAFQEWIAAAGRRYRYAAFSAEKGHVAVEML
jgi:methyltransferase family protein